MDAYRDEGMGDIIFGELFLKEVGINAKLFEGMITIHDSNEEVTYQMVRSYPRFKHHTNEQCNKIPPLLKVSIRRIPVYGYDDLTEKKSTKLVKDLQSGNLESVRVLKLQDGCSTHNLAHKLNLENLPSKISWEFLILVPFNSYF
ncbi:hypothetical protein Tco_0793239 [Tanacetum coccineum]